jgi:lipopolysaccharide biosynthesis protein
MQGLSTQLAISVYLYHIDMWDEIYGVLKNISTPYKLYIGLCTETLSAPFESKIKEDLVLLGKPYVITYHENYGADIPAFLHHIDIIEESYFIKIHSKKSKLGEHKQINWFTVLINDLIGSESIVCQNLYRLQSNQKIGILSNKNNIKYNLEYTNSDYIKNILAILNIDYEKVKNGLFVGGTMFMSKTSIYKSVFTKDHIISINNLLKQHRGKLSDNIIGTYAHAMERILGYVVSYQKYYFKSIHNNTISINNHTTNKNYDLVIMYNKECYIKNFIGTYGKIIKETVNKNFNEYTILWYNKEKTIKNYICDKQA